MSGQGWTRSLEQKEIYSLAKSGRGLGPSQTWRTIMRPQALKERLATDPHSPDEIRCNQTARNINEFHEAFGTTPGDGLWLDPSERVRIW